MLNTLIVEVTMRPVGDEMAQAGIGHQAVSPHGGQIGIHGHINTARLENGNQRCDQLQRPLQRHPDENLRSHPESDQRVR